MIGAVPGVGSGTPIVIVAVVDDPSVAVGIERYAGVP